MRKECQCDCHGQWAYPHPECAPWCRHDGIPECVCPTPGSLEDESMIEAAQRCYEAQIAAVPENKTH